MSVLTLTATTPMDESKWFQIGLGISALIFGLMAGRYRLGKDVNMNIERGISTLTQFEGEVYQVLKSMRKEMDGGFDLFREQHAEMLRRLRRTDDDIFEIKERLKRLEEK